MLKSHRKTAWLFYELFFSLSERELFLPLSAVLCIKLVLSVRLLVMNTNKDAGGPSTLRRLHLVIVSERLSTATVTQRIKFANCLFVCLSVSCPTPEVNSIRWSICCCILVQELIPIISFIVITLSETSCPLRTVHYIVALENCVLSGAYDKLCKDEEAGGLA